MNRRVCILTTVHPPFDTRVFHKEAKTLASAGYEVILIAQHTCEEVVDGIRILPLPKPRGRLDRMTRLAFRALRLALRQEAAVYHFHDPELIPVGLVLRLFMNRVVYDVHEDVSSDIRIKKWINILARGMIAVTIGKVEDIASRTFDAVVAATPAIANKFPAQKRALVQNYAIREELFDGTEVAYGQRGQLIAYVGGIVDVRGAREMVEAMHKLTEAGARLLLAGRIEPASLHAELQSLPGWPKVEDLGFQPRAAVRMLLGRSRLGLVVLHPIPTFLESQPTKLYEYMSAGIPVIASDFPAWRKVVEGAGCGLLVNPLDPNRIAEAIDWILKHPLEAQAMGERGREAMLSYYNWDTQATSLLKVYERLLA